MDFNYVLLVIVLVLGNKALKDTKKANKFKNTLLKVTRYSIIAVYLFGVYQYLTKDGSRNPRSIVDSMLKTIN